MSYGRIFGMEFEKTAVIFEVSTFKFVKHEILTKKVNCGIGSVFFEGPGLGPLSKTSHL